MNAPSQPAAELTIGIVGTHDLVEKIMLSGPLAGPAGPAEQAVPARRLIAAAYRDEQEAADRVTRLGPGIDVCLFASKVPYGYARKAGVLSSPATYISLGGSALYAALLRACLTSRHDLTRASVDVLSRSAVDEAMAEIGMPASHVHVQDEPGTPAALAAFHERLWRAGRTSVAFTCLRSVAARLSAARVPVYPVSPTGPAIRSALRTAALLGANRRLEAAQLTVVVVEVPGLREGQGRRSVSRLSREELRLAVHRLLVQEALRMQASVTPLGDHGFLVTATGGSLSAVTDGFRRLPFVDRARAELGLGLEVGVGTGATAQAAETQARARIARLTTPRAARRPAAGPAPAPASGPVQAWPARTAPAVPAARAGGNSPHPAAAPAAGPAAAASEAAALAEPGLAEQTTPGRGAAADVSAPIRASAARADAEGAPRALATLSRLAELLPPGDSVLAVDAETASRVLEVTPRTARRLLRALAEEGLAWPLPPNRAPQPGRPRQSYRLVVERLDRNRAADDG
ncbi:MAG TPA: transcriptional regulator [Streptosporangiaceae bacterium]